MEDALILNRQYWLEGFWRGVHLELTPVGPRHGWAEIQGTPRANYANVA